MNESHNAYLQELREQMAAIEAHLDEYPADTEAALFLQLTKKHYDAMLALDQTN